MPEGDGDELVADIIIEAEGWRGFSGLLPLIEQAAGAAYAARPRGQAEVAIVLGDDAAQQRLNAAYRGKHASTNVLSFPGGATPVGAPHLLGDIVLAFETVEREALEEHKPLPHHAAHLVVHGMLHLLGHAHEDVIEAERMESLETRILAGLGIPDPYAEPAPTSVERDG